MSTRSSVRNLFPPLDNPELTIRRRSRADPTLLNHFEMVAEGNGDLPHKVNGVTDDALSLYLFSHSLTHHATSWFDYLLRNSINTFEKMAKMFLGKYFPPYMVTKLKNEITTFCQRLDESLFEAWECYKHSIDRCPKHNMLLVTQIDTFYNGLTLRHRDTINAATGGTFMKRRLEECYDLIENMTAHHNDWDTSVQRSESSSSITSSSDMKIAALKAEMEKINKNLMRVLQVNQLVKAVILNCETCGGPRSFNDCLANVGNTQNVYAVGAYQGNTITNPKEDLKGITTRSGTAYQGPTIPTTSSSLPSVVKRETDVTKDTVHLVAPIIEPVASPVSTPKPDQRPSIPYPSRLHDQKLRDKANFDADPRVPLILGRSFLKTKRALIDVFEGELTLREFSQEVLGFFDMIVSGNPTPYYDPIVSTISLTLTPFGESHFLLEEVDAFLALKDDPTSPEVDQSYVDTEGDILLLKAFLNDDPSLPPPNQENYFPQVRKELIICEAKTDKSLIDEPPEEDFKPAVQHQRRVNPKIHDVIKNEVLKLLDAGLIYPISDSPWVLLLQEFRFKVIDTKGAENMATDHLSRLENPHQNVLDPKEINESFPLETLNMVSSRGNSSTPNVQLNELRDQAYENSVIYKEKTKRLHSSKIKDCVFNIGDRVLLFNSRLKIFSGKLKSCWSVPFTISYVFPYGTVELTQPDGPNFKVNGHKLKHYFGDNIPKMVVPNLQTFPKDQ
nr:reverse transcriptase domain-containing protein [Tanacetum cinerariifolium]